MNEKQRFSVYEGSASPDPAREASSSGGGGRDDIRERLARLEAEIKHLATKEDILKLENKMLGGVLKFIGVVAGVAITAGLGIAALIAKFL